MILLKLPLERALPKEKSEAMGEIVRSRSTRRGRRARVRLCGVEVDEELVGHWRKS